MRDRIDLVGLSQTRYARSLRRDLDMVDEHLSYTIRPVRMPAVRSRGRIFRALASADEWLWSGRADVPCGILLTAVILAIAAVAIRSLIHW